MIFGDAVRSADPADATDATDWIDDACRGGWWTVGGLVPNDHQSFVRIDAPPADVEDWWSAYRELFAVVAAIGARHTTAPDRAWFAIWDGHGLGSATVHAYWDSPPADEAERRARDVERSRLAAESERRRTVIETELARIPRLRRPHRAHLLLAGTVPDVTELRHPDGRPWINPDLFWPDDRAWFVATDVDFWSLYVGAPRRMVRELADVVPTTVEPVGLDQPLVIED